MPEIKRILVIDDDPDIRESLTTIFQNEGIDVCICATKDDALKQIESGLCYDLVLLDWYLEDPEDSSLSQLILARLKGNRFVPVFIWSQHIHDFREQLGAHGIDYPIALVSDISKLEFTHETIKQKVDELYQSSIATKIGATYRGAISKALEETFFDLATIPNADIAVILRSIVGNEGAIDWSNDFILNLIHRRLLIDQTFINQLSGLLRSDAAPGVPADERSRRQIANRILYFRSPSQSIRAGDIVRIRFGETTKFGVIVTPDCDIDQSNTRFLEVVEMKRFDDNNIGLNAARQENIRRYNHPSFYFFPSVLLNPNYVDMVAILKSRLILEGVIEAEPPIFPRPSAKLQYASRFVYNNQEIGLDLICTVADPYKSDFLHHLRSHDSRVGTPDIKQLWINP